MRKKYHVKLNSECYYNKTLGLSEELLVSTISVAYLGFHFGGVPNFSGKVGEFAWRETPCSAWRSHAFARGFGGMLPRENFKKWCNLVRFREYFAKILSKKYF